MLTTTTTHLPITLSLHVTIIVVVGILYLEGREGKGREGKGREGKGSIGIGYKRNENYCLKTVKTCRKLIRQKSKSYCRHSLLGIF